MENLAPKKEKRLSAKEKMEFTVDFQFEKLVQELMTDIYFSGYEGYVAAVIENFSLELSSVELGCEIKTIKLKNISEAPNNSLLFHVKQGSGFKLCTPQKK